MKQATGELNSTIVIALIVSGLLAFFFSVLWPMIKNSQASSLNCQKAVCGVDCDGKKLPPINGTIKCCYKKDQPLIDCPYKG